jgi:hypothetical protein
VSIRRCSAQIGPALVGRIAGRRMRNTQAEHTLAAGPRDA